MTAIEYTDHQTAAHTLREQLEQMQLIRAVEDAIDKQRCEHGSFVERTPVDFGDAECAIEFDKWIEIGKQQ